MALFFAMPVYTALIISTLNRRAQGDPSIAAALPRLFRQSVFGGDNFFLAGATILLAVLIALTKFSYLFSKQQVDLFHGVPARRHELFIANYVGGVISFVIPYIISVVISLIIAASFSLVDGTLLLFAAASLGITILGFLAVYAMGILAACMTGTVAVSVLASLVFAFYFPVIRLMIIMLNERFFVTNMTYGSDFLVTKLSPVFSYVACSTQIGGTNMLPEVRTPDLITLILYILVLTALDVVLFTVRKSEAAGKSMAFDKSKRIIAILLSVPISIFGALAFEGIAGNGGKLDYAWFIFGAAILLVLAHIIIQAIYCGDVKSIIKGLECPAIAAVIVALISILYVFDVTGHDSFVPAADKLESMAVSSYSMQSTINYYHFDSQPNEYGNVEYWGDVTDHRFQNMKITDTALIQKLAQIGNEESKQYHDVLFDDESRDVVYDIDTVEEEIDTDSDDYTHWCDISVQYTMKSGKKIYRSYTIDFYKNIDLYNEIYTANGYKEGVYTILTEPMAEGDTLNLMDAGGETPLTMLSEAQQKELIDTFCAELRAQGAYALKDSIPVAEIYATKKIVENGYTNTYNYNEGYIYPEFTRTLALIKSYGIELNSTLVPENISSIDVCNYNAEAYENLETTKTYTDADSIRKIMEAAAPSSFASTEDYFHPLENIDTTVNFITPDKNNSKCGYMVFERGTIPEFVKKDVNWSE